MDISILIGFGLGVGGIIWGDILEHGKLAALLAPSPIFIVFGGTFGVIFVGFPLKDVLKIPSILFSLLFPPHMDLKEMTDTLSRLAEKAYFGKKDDIKPDLEDIDDEFMARGLRFVANNAQPEIVESIMSLELESIRSAKTPQYKMFESMGGFAPTMGIIGTVLGLIQVLGNISEP